MSEDKPTDHDLKTVAACMTGLNKVTDKYAIHRAIDMMAMQLGTWQRLGLGLPLKVNRGDRFTVTVGDSVVLMETHGIYCADVWNCYPVHAGGKRVGGVDGLMIFTDDELVRKCAAYQSFG